MIINNFTDKANYKIVLTNIYDESTEIQCTDVYFMYKNNGDDTYTNSINISYLSDQKREIEEAEITKFARVKKVDIYRKKYNEETKKYEFILFETEILPDDKMYFFNYLNMHIMMDTDLYFYNIAYNETERKTT